MREAAKGNKAELREVISSMKQGKTYTQDELDAISSMAARHAAIHVEQSFHHSSDERHIHSKELHKLNKEIMEKKSKVRETTKGSIKAAVE